MKNANNFIVFLKFYWHAPLLKCHSFYGYAMYKYIHELLSLILLRTNTTYKISCSNFQIFILFHKENFECLPITLWNLQWMHQKVPRWVAAHLNCVKVFIMIEVYHQSILESSPSFACGTKPTPASTFGLFYTERHRYKNKLTQMSESLQIARTEINPVSFWQGWIFLHQKERCEDLWATTTAI